MPLVAPVDWKPQTLPPGVSTPVAAICGVGLVSPLGLSINETWAALLAGRSLRTTGRSALASQSDVPRVCLLAAEAARAAIGDVSHSKFPRPMALVVGTSKGPIDAWFTPPPAPSEHIDSMTCIAAGRMHICGVSEIARHVASNLGLTGPAITLSGACASGLQALIRGTMLIQSGEATRVLVVAAESSLHPLFLACYKRLGVLAPAEVGCRPFDRSRKGFFVSEAAAAVLLEVHRPAPDAAKSSDPESGSRPIAVVDGYGSGSDATHLTGSDPDARTLRHLLTRVVRDGPIDLVHAHGTGTPTNDPMELAAVEAVLGSAAPPAAIYSHKGALGHALGASGLMAVVLNCLAHRDGIVPPNVQTFDPLPTRAVAISRNVVDRTVTRSIVAASGFGGATAVVALRKA